MNIARLSLLRREQSAGNVNYRCDSSDACVLHGAAGRPLRLDHVMNVTMTSRRRANSRLNVASIDLSVNPASVIADDRLPYKLLCKTLSRIEPFF